MPGSVVPFKGQKYSALKKQALSSGHSFEDPEFPRDEKSLFRGQGRASGIEWKRPRVCNFHCIKLFLLFIICTWTMKMLVSLILSIHLLSFYVMMNDGLSRCPDGSLGPPSCMSRLYTVGHKKHTKMCFAITLVKLDGFWTNLADCFLNKFFIKQCKQMSPEPSTSFVLSTICWNLKVTNTTVT